MLGCCGKAAPFEPKEGAGRTYVCDATSAYRPASLPLPPTVLGAFSNTGKNTNLLEPKSNQDRGLVVYPFNGDYELALCVVMDSHGEKGELIAEFSIRQFSEILAHEVESHGLQDMRKILNRSVVRVDELLNSRDDLPHRVAGTTLTAVLLRPNEAWVANVGDSHCVIGQRHCHTFSSSWQVYSHSVDHTPNNTEEFVRVKSAGAHIDSMRIFASSSKSGAGVGTGLLLSRSLGNSWARGVGIISTPDVKHVRLSTQDEVLVVASDGVWEFTNSLQAIKIVGKHSNASSACERLIKYSTRRWAQEQSSYRDDITAIVVRLPALFNLMKEVNATCEANDELVKKPMISSNPM